MKKISILFIGILIGGLVFGSIGTVLALTYKASDIVYSPSDTSWNVSTVGEAINSLALSKTETNYSTEEQVVGSWIDGKPIYQKTFTNVAVNSSLLSNVELVVNIFAINKRNDNLYWYGDGNSAYNGLDFEITNGNVIIHNIGSSYNMGNIEYVTIQYIKTTDTVLN